VCVLTLFFILRFFLKFSQKYAKNKLKDMLTNYQKRDCAISLACEVKSGLNRIYNQRIKFNGGKRITRKKDIEVFGEFCKKSIKKIEKQINRFARTNKHNWATDSMHYLAYDLFWTDGSSFYRIIDMINGFLYYSYTWKDYEPLDTLEKSCAEYLYEVLRDREEYNLNILPLLYG